MSAVKDIFVWGAGGHARVVADIVRLDGRFRVAGFIDDINPNRKGEAFCGASILGGADILAQPNGAEHVVLAFGDGRSRLRLFERLSARGVDFPAFAHPSAVIAGDIPLPPGCVICAGAVVSPGARLGSQTIVNTAGIVDHDCTVGHGAHVCPGVTLAGHVTVGDCAWIGAGATVIDRVTIGVDTVVGAGAVVVDDLPACVLAYGCPAKVIRSLALETHPR